MHEPVEPAAADALQSPGNAQIEMPAAAATHEGEEDAEGGNGENDDQKGAAAPGEGTAGRKNIADAEATRGRFDEKPRHAALAIAWWSRAGHN